MRVTFNEADWSSCESLAALEAFIGEGHTCAMSSMQTAIQACLELLGSRSATMPVILPVTAPPDTLAGVLRAGAYPLLLDIDETTLQMDSNQLKEAIRELATQKLIPIVLFNKPFGMPISSSLLDLVQDLPSILDARTMPHPNLVEEDIPCVFNIFDLSTVCGAGAVIIHKYIKQVTHLKLIGSGIMGLSGALSEPQALLALHKTKTMPSNIIVYGGIIEQYQTSDLEIMGPSKEPSPLWVKVPNARQAIAHLASYGIEAVLGLYPLHNLEEVRQRYKEMPDYVVANKLENRFICLPTHRKVLGLEKEIIKRLKEVNGEEN